MYTYIFDTDAKFNVDHLSAMLIIEWQTTSIEYFLEKNCNILCNVKCMQFAYSCFVLLFCRMWQWNEIIVNERVWKRTNNGTRQISMLCHSIFRMSNTSSFVHITSVVCVYYTRRKMLIRKRICTFLYPLVDSLHSTRRLVATIPRNEIFTFLILFLSLIFVTYRLDIFERKKDQTQYLSYNYFKCAWFICLYYTSFSTFSERKNSNIEHYIMSPALLNLHL